MMNNKTVNIEQEVMLKANYKISRASEDVIALIMDETGTDKDTIATVLRDYSGRWRHMVRVYETHNIVPSILRNSLATLISGTPVAPSFKANYVALGNGGGTPSDTNVALASETLRSTFTNRYSVDNVALLDRFFTAQEVGGMTFTEAGIFVDGTMLTNSGFLLSRILMNESISLTETLTINASITIV